MINRTPTALALTLLAAVATGCDRASDTEELVARADDYRLTVDQAVDLLVDVEDLPMQASVVQSLAELWVDYTLLAEAAAEDSTFEAVDFRGLVRPLVEQEMVLQLRDSVIQVDTSITDEELLDLYEAEGPEMELRARHILLTYPPQATQAQRDSVRARLEEIRARIVGGAGFEETARSVSQDPGTAAAGGDLGFFGRGEMVAPFEEAVLSLEPGELSEVVETPLGLHLIRLENRRVRDFDEVSVAFRQAVQARRTVAAESTFIAGLEGRSVPVVVDGALGVARELARSPDTRLSGSAVRRPLLEWEGGAYTAGELLELIRAEQGGLRDEILRRTDDELRNFLRTQARRKLLVEEARQAGLGPPQATVDSLAQVAGTQLRAAARSLGLLRLDRAPGEALEPAVSRAVRRALESNLSGATQIVPLGLVGYQLRQGVPIAIYNAGIGDVLLRVAQVRATRAESPLEQGVAPPTEPTDTTAR